MLNHYHVGVIWKVTVQCHGFPVYKFYYRGQLLAFALFLFYLPLQT